MAVEHLTKKCANCGQDKPVSEFRKLKTRFYSYCDPCAKHRARLRYEANRQAYIDRVKQWREQNPEQYKQDGKDYYAKTKDRQLQRHAEYYLQNREQCLARSIGWRKADPTKARKNEAAYRERNREACNERIKEWKSRNKGRVVYYSSARQRGVKRATPQWADHEVMIGIYAEARRLTAETGTPHHVDHIVPINNKIVCGLHVPWNLRVVTADENLRKCNYRWPDMP